MPWQVGKPADDRPSSIGQPVTHHNNRCVTWQDRGTRGRQRAKMSSMVSRKQKNFLKYRQRARPVAEKKRKVVQERPRGKRAPIHTHIRQPDTAAVHQNWSSSSGKGKGGQGSDDKKSSSEAFVKPPLSTTAMAEPVLPRKSPSRHPPRVRCGWGL